MRRMKRTPLVQIALFVSISVAVSRVAKTQDAKQQSKPSAPSQSDSISTENLPPLQLDSNAILHHLNQVIGWYRHATTGIRDVGLPSDAIYQDSAKSLGAQAVQLAFQSAKAESLLVAGSKNGAGQSNTSNTQQQNLTQLRAKTTSQIDQLQSQITALDAKLHKMPGSKRTSAIAQRDALAGELELQKSLLDAIQKMTAFVETNGDTAGGLEGDINRLAQTVPEVLAHLNAEKPATTQGKIEAAKATSKPSLSNSGGLIGDATTLYDYTAAMRQISGVIKETNYTRGAAEQLRKPLRDALRATIQESQQLASQNSTTDVQQLQAQRQQLQEINERFKQLSSAMLPLSQEIIVLNNSRTNLEEWSDSIARESKYVLRAVLLRVLAIVVALAAGPDSLRSLAARYVSLYR